MKNLNGDLSAIISENLTRLYAFAHLLTSDDKNAEGLIYSLFTEISGRPRDRVISKDFQTSLFRSLYRLYAQGREQEINYLSDESLERIEEFYLYNRLAEDHLHDQHKILEFISEIKQTDLDKIVSAIPAALQPYRFLSYICDFSYQQIATILNVPLEQVEPCLAMVNKIIQEKLWENIEGNKGKVLHEDPRSLRHEGPRRKNTSGLVIGLR